MELKVENFDSLTFTVRSEVIKLEQGGVAKWNNVSSSMKIEKHLIMKYL